MDPISIQGSGNSILTLKGNNTLNTQYTGIRIDGDASLTITSDSTENTLTINNDTINSSGPGIGNYDYDSGEITISGGTIVAYGGGGYHDAPGIGVTAGDNCGAITITGGDVTAYSGGSGSPAIGCRHYGSDYAYLESLTITGGTVRAINSSNGTPGYAAIRAKRIDISGGTVIADGKGYSGIEDSTNDGIGVVFSGGYLYSSGYIEDWFPAIKGGLNITDLMPTNGGVFLGSDKESEYYINKNEDQQFFTNNTKVQTVATSLGLSGEPWSSAESVYYEGYAVEYDANGGSGAQTDANSPYLKGENATILNQGTMTNGTLGFTGWNTLEGGGGTPYSVGNTISSISDNYLLYAQWALIQHTVSASAGTGGSVSPASQTVTDGNNASPITATASTGYHFVRWSDGNTANPRTYTNVTSDISVSAVFALNTYTVNFYGNGASGGSTASQGFTYGTAQNLNANGFNKTGYTLAGWATSAGGSVVYTNSQSVNNLTTTNGGIISLYAKWTPNNYTVRFNGNGNDGGSTADQGFTYDSAQDLTQNGFTKTDYTFGGWATSSGGAVVYQDKQSVNNLTAVNGGTVNLYAKWAISRTLTYTGNGNTGGSMVAEQRGEGMTNPLTANSFSKTGYHFTGWNTEKNGGGTLYLNGVDYTMPTEDSVLYAQWEANDYSVKFNGNKGSGSSSISGSMTNQSFVYNTAQDLNANAFSRAGYAYSGWSTTEGGSVEYTDEENVLNLTSEENGAFNLYAVWSVNDFDIVFDGNGYTSGSIGNQTITFDQSEALTENAFQKTGYTFAGWNTLSGGGGTAYADKVAFTMDVEGDTLYAQWTAIDYTVTYNENSGGGTAPVDTNQYHYEDNVNVLDKGAISKTGYSFVCWNTMGDGQGTDYDPADTFNMPADNVILYAKWSADDQNITYDNNGGTGADSDIQPTDNIFKLSSGSGFTRTDYLIDGWKIEGKDYQLGALYQMPPYAVTAEAIWADDSDNDGVSDDDETASGTDPNDANDKMKTGKLDITVLGEDGSAAGGYTLRLNSEPIEMTTDSNGKTMFGSVTLSQHTLTLINGTTKIGAYALHFTRDTSNSTLIVDDASTDSDGSVLTNVAGNFLTLNLTIQQNSSGNWQLILVEYTESLPNPETGEDLR